MPEQPVMAVTRDWNIMHKVAHELRSALHERGITQAQAAAAVGVTQKHLSRVLQGHQGASWKELNWWSLALGIEWTVVATARGEVTVPIPEPGKRGPKPKSDARNTEPS